MRRTLVVSLIMMLMVFTPPAYASDYTIEVYSIYSEVEEGFNTLLYASCMDALGVSHKDNVTFLISGVEFTYNDWSGRYEAATSENTPKTVEYGTLNDFDDSENATSIAEITLNATVTWTQSRLDFVLPYAKTGDLLGFLFAIDTYMMGSLFIYTFIVSALSLALYNYSGWEATLLCWLLMWGSWSVLVQGTASSMGLVMLSLGG